MTKLFISYRRSDAEAYAGRIYDHLARLFDESDVFMDVDSIAPGTNFVEMLNNTLAEIDVMLVVIGSNWLTARDEKGRRRLDQKGDFVFQEIAAALKRDIAVIPVLVARAEMPTSEDLPDGIADLANRNAVSLRHERFTDDTKRLASAILNLRARLLDNKTSKLLRKFEHDIAEEYEAAFTFENLVGDPRISLFFASNEAISTPWHSYLIKDAIVYLIEESADVSGWVKHEDELRPEAFWEAILRAVAKSYRRELPFPTDDFSDADLLRQFLTELDGTQETRSPKSERQPSSEVEIISNEDDEYAESQWADKSIEVAAAIYDLLTAVRPYILVVGDAEVTIKLPVFEKIITIGFMQLNIDELNILRSVGWDFGRQIEGEITRDAAIIEHYAEQIILAHRAIGRSVEDIYLQRRDLKS